MALLGRVDRCVGSGCPAVLHTHLDPMITKEEDILFRGGFVIDAASGDTFRLTDISSVRRGGTSVFIQMDGTFFTWEFCDTTQDDPVEAAEAAKRVAKKISKALVEAARWPTKSFTIGEDRHEHLWARLRAVKREGVRVKLHWEDGDHSTLQTPAICDALETCALIRAGWDHWKNGPSLDPLPTVDA